MVPESVCRIRTPSLVQTRTKTRTEMINVHHGPRIGPLETATKVTRIDATTSLRSSSVLPPAVGPARRWTRLPPRGTRHSRGYGLVTLRQIKMENRVAPVIGIQTSLSTQEVSKMTLRAQQEPATKVSQREGLPSTSRIAITRLSKRRRRVEARCSRWSLTTVAARIAGPLNRTDRTIETRASLLIPRLPRLVSTSLALTKTASQLRRSSPSFFPR